MKALFVVLLTLGATLAALSPASAAGSLAFELLEQGFSHLAPHLLDQLPLSAEERAGPQPPAELIAPLANEEEQVAKGIEPDQEDALARALLSLPLRQRLLKVAVATVNDKRMALIKLQAGDARTGVFRVADLEDDAVSALRVAFALPMQLTQVDLWSVVPGKDRSGPVHQPIFSLCADRRAFGQADRGPRAAREILGELGLIRFAPEFLRYSAGSRVLAPFSDLPGTAWSAAPLGDTWSTLRKSCSQDPRLPVAAFARVVVNIPVTDNSVALTVDDGPHPLITTLFLDILRKSNVKATFFVVGEKVEECPELLRRMSEEGQEIGNHTYSHPRLGHVADDEALAQIRGGGAGHRQGVRAADAAAAPAGRSDRRPRPSGRHRRQRDGGPVDAQHQRLDPYRPRADRGQRPPRPQARVDHPHAPGRHGERAGLALDHRGRSGPRGLRLTTVGDMLSRAPVGILPIPEIMSLYQRHLLEKE